MASNQGYVEIHLDVSFSLWKSRGRISAFTHSKLLGMWDRLVIVRWAANASHIRKINNRRATNLIIEPKEDTMFHFV